MNKKVALIGTNGIPAKYGGFETLTEFLAKNLNNEFEITVYCSKIKKELNWSPQTGFDEGLDITVECEIENFQNARDY